MHIYIYIYEIDIELYSTVLNPIREMASNKVKTHANNLVRLSKTSYEAWCPTLLFLNPLSHSGHCIGQPSKISILVKEGIIKKYPMSVAPTSR